MSRTDRLDAISAVAAKSSQIAQQAQSMLTTEDALLVPVISKVVSRQDQEAFNNQVIRNLGILDSRLHLVGMHEAVVNSHSEYPLFQQTIPRIPQMLIPRWKRLLYQPKWE